MEKITAGEAAFCALRSDGSVYCWGTYFGETAVKLDRFANAIDVTVGTSNNVCAIMADGAVRCAGNNEYAQSNPGHFGVVAEPATVPGIGSAVGISAGDFHVCALLRDGTVKCWGTGDWGQLGSGSSPEPASLGVVSVSGIHDAVKVAAGYSHTCALLQDRTVWCWGWLPGFEGSGAPSDIGVSDAVDIASGYEQICIALGDGSVICRGLLNEYCCGPGFGPGDDLLDFGADRATTVDTGATHHCALLDSGSVQCWGSNGVGQLGYPGYTTNDKITRVTGIVHASAVAVSYGATLANAYFRASGSSCALQANGSVLCWGGTSPTRDYDPAVPRLVSGL